MSWDYRFGALILLSTAIDYYVGLKLSSENREKVRYYLLLFSLITNLVFILGFFKYYNFLVTSINTVTNPMFGADAFPVLKIILPAGISFLHSNLCLIPLMCIEKKSLLKRTSFDLHYL